MNRFARSLHPILPILPILCIALLTALPSRGATVFSTADGNWTNAALWSAGIPNSSEDAHVVGVTCTIDQPGASCRQLRPRGGGTVVVTNGAELAVASTSTDSIIVGLDTYGEVVVYGGVINANNIQVGRRNGGQGTFSQFGGAVTSQVGLTVGMDTPATNLASVYNYYGGTLDCPNGNVTVGYGYRPAIFNHGSGQTLDLGTDRNLYIRGLPSVSNSVYNMHGGRLACKQMVANSAVFNQYGGLIELHGNEGFKWETGTSVYNMYGGMLNAYGAVRALYFGRRDNAHITFNQTGTSAVSVASQVEVGGIHYGPATAIYNISDTARLQCGALYVAGGVYGPATNKMGYFNQSGGSVSVDTHVYVGHYPYCTGTVTIADGTFAAGGTLYLTPPVSSRSVLHVQGPGSTLNVGTLNMSDAGGDCVLRFSFGAGGGIETLTVDGGAGTIDGTIEVDVLPDFDMSGGSGGNPNRYDLIAVTGGTVTDGGHTFTNLSGEYTITVVDTGTADGTYTVEVRAPVPAGTLVLVR